MENRIKSLFGGRCHCIVGKLATCLAGILPKWSLGYILAAPVQIQLAANGLGQTMKDGLRVWVPATHGGCPGEALGLSFSSAGCCEYLRTNQ